MKLLYQMRQRIQPRIAARFPLLIRCVRILKWRVAGPIRKALIRHKAIESGLHVDPYQVYWISPHVMKHTIYGPDDVPNPATVSGMIKEGDWDRKTLPIEELDIVQGAKDRFTAGMDWPETEYYQSHLDRILTGEQWRGCRSKQDLDEYFTQFDRLYEKIKKNGYRPQSELREAEFGDTAPVEHEITVHIDRGGRFLFCDGRHRLAIALVLGIEKIPVKVCIRHAKWHEFCQEILTSAKSSGGKVYQPLTHPDLQNIPSAHDEDRLVIISKHLPESKGDLLDIGANWGFFCHRFEELGFNCYAVETDPETAYFLEKLRIAQDRRFTVINKSILTYTKKRRFDIVLALNIFHHFLKTKGDYDALTRFLEQMDMDAMIFEPHHTTEPQMKNAYRNYEPDEFVNFIQKHSCLNHSDLIGTAEDGRSIYKLRK